MNILFFYINKHLRLIFECVNCDFLCMYVNNRNDNLLISLAFQLKDSQKVSRILLLIVIFITNYCRLICSFSLIIFSKVYICTKGICIHCILNQTSSKTILAYEIVSID